MSAWECSEPADWSVSITASATPDSTRSVGDEVEEATSVIGALYEVGASSPGASVSADGYLEATYALNASGAQKALADAIELWHQVSKRCAFDSWPVRAVKLVTPEAIHREYDRTGLPDLVGVSEVAEMLGVSKQRVSVMRSDESQFPRPLAELRSGPVWATAGIERYAANRAVRPGRPSRRELAAQGFLEESGSEA